MMILFSLKPSLKKCIPNTLRLAGIRSLYLAFITLVLAISPQTLRCDIETCIVLHRTLYTHSARWSSRETMAKRPGLSMIICNKRPESSTLLLSTRRQSNFLEYVLQNGLLWGISDEMKHEFSCAEHALEMIRSEMVDRNVVVTRHRPICPFCCMSSWHYQTILDQIC